MLLLLASLYLFLTLAIYVSLKWMVFHPQALPEDHRFDFNANFEELQLPTLDGEQINAIWFPGEVPENTQGLVLYFHGNQGTLQRWARYYETFVPKGYACLFVDYRGYGKSTGIPTEEGLYQDALAAWEWAVQHYEPSDITIFGRSLGTGVASYLAAQKQPKQLILETPYNSIVGVVQAFVPFLWFPVAPSPNFSNERYLPTIECPIFIVHGTHDWVVPYRSAKQLRPLLRPKDDFLIIGGGGHKNLGSYPAYQAWLDEIL